MRPFVSAALKNIRINSNSNNLEEKTDKEEGPTLAPYDSNHLSNCTEHACHCPSLSNSNLPASSPLELGIEGLIHYLITVTSIDIQKTLVSQLSIAFEEVSN